MKYILYNEKKEIVIEQKDNATVLANFTADLFNKYILKSKDVKQVQYHYNYSDTQKITFIFKNGYRAIYLDIPTKTRLFG
jgi:hypothetical protein